MKKAFCTIFAILFIIVCIPCESHARKLTIVYVTNTGKFYHTMDCYHLISKNEITLVDAIIRNYEPCSDCNPPEMTEDDWDELLEVIDAREKSRSKETISNAKKEYEENQEIFERKVRELEEENEKKDTQTILSFVIGCIASCIATNIYRDNKH